MLYGVEAQELFAGGAAAPGGDAVHFAGSTWLSIASLAATDNAFLSFSLWEKGLTSAANNASICFVGDAAGGYTPSFWTSSTGETRVYTKNGTPQFRKYFSAGSADWHHHLCSVDTNHSAGTKIMAYYLDDVLLTATTTIDATAAFTMLFNGKSFHLGDDGSGFSDLDDCDLADVWIAPGVSLLSGSTIPDATRRQFTDYPTGGPPSPIDPATFPTSAILFYGNAASFATNHGTGGSFTLTGSLTDAATHP